MPKGERDLRWFPKLDLCFQSHPDKDDGLYINRELPSGAREFSRVRSPYRLLPFLERQGFSNLYLHEVIPGERYRKFFLDLDGDPSSLPREGSLKKTCLSVLRRVFEKHFSVKLGEVSWYTSHSKSKFSAHVVVQDFCFGSPLECKRLCAEVASSLPERLVDQGVYRHNSSLRMLWSSKRNSTRVKRLSGLEPGSGRRGEVAAALARSLVSWTHGCCVLHLELPDPPKAWPSGEDLSSETTQRLMELFYDREAHKVAGVRGSLLLLQRKKPSPCKICSRVHQRESGFIAVHGTSAYYYCRRSENRLYIGEVEIDLLGEVESDLLGELLASRAPHLSGKAPAERSSERPPASKSSEKPPASKSSEEPPSGGSSDKSPPGGPSERSPTGQVLLPLFL